MTQAERHAAETAELGLLTGDGFGFSLVVQRPQPKRWGIIPRKKISERVEYRIAPPTLGTLLRIAREGVELFDAVLDDDGDPFALSWLSVERNAERMCRVLALAILGPSGTDRDAVAVLTEQLAEALSPRELFDLIQRLYLSCNLADFINSTRLVRAQRPTEGARVERKV